jgi:dolichol-phosphate mannosyltransferase
MSVRPLQAMLLFGFALSSLSFLYLAWVVLAYFFTDRSIRGWSSIIVAVLFLGGLQLNTVGLVGLYVAKIYDETKGRPIYIVRRKEGRLQR